MAADDRDPVQRVCTLLTALVRERTLTYEQAAERMGVRHHRATEIVRECARVIPWVRLEKVGRRVVLRAHGVNTTDPKVEVAVAACLGASLATLFAGTRYHDGMRQALEFVVSASPNPSRFVDLDRRFLFVAGGGEVAFEKRAELLDRIVRAVLQRRVIRFEYQGFKEGDTRASESAEPWTIAIHKHQLYVIGRATNGEVWVWRFARMHAVRMLTKTFDYPTRDAYDPGHVFDESFGIWLQPRARLETVEVVLSRRWAAYARAHKWHRSQVRSALPDGRVLIRLNVKICGELKQWILGFGPDAEVRAPAGLRAEIARDLRATLAHYDAHPTGREAAALEPQHISRSRRGRGRGAGE